MKVFNTGQVHGGSFKAADLTLQVAGADAKGAMFQNVQYTFQQELRTFFEIGTNNVYWVGGRATGNLSIGRLLGPGSSLLTRTVLTTYNDMCEPKNMSMASNSTQCVTGRTATQAGTANNSLNLEFIAVTLTQIGGNVAAQDVIVTQNLGFTFIDLDDLSADGPR